MLIWAIRRRGNGYPAGLTRSDGPAGLDRDASGDLRFVVHRHTDDAGPHVDLRIERPDRLLAGWRLPADAIDRLSSGDEVVCVLKPQHSADWLDHDSAECTAVDSGTYSETAMAADGSRRVVFRGRLLDGEFEFRPERDEVLVAVLAETIRETTDGPVGRDTADEVVAAVRDGRAARARAIERLCGLGRELDGDAFDQQLWRRMLAGLSLAEIHRQMARFERRFDEKYPPRPVTRSVPPPEEDSDRRELVAGILEECV